MIFSGVIFGWFLGSFVCKTLDYIFNSYHIFSRNKILGLIAALTQISLTAISCEHLSKTVNRKVIGYAQGGFENAGFMIALTSMQPQALQTLIASYEHFHIILYGDEPVVEPSSDPPIGDGGNNLDGYCTMYPEDPTCQTS